MRKRTQVRQKGHVLILTALGMVVLVAPSALRSIRAAVI